MSVKQNHGYGSGDPPGTITKLPLDGRATCPDKRRWRSGLDSRTFPGRSCRTRMRRSTGCKGDYWDCSVCINSGCYPSSNSGWKVRRGSLRLTETVKFREMLQLRWTEGSLDRRLSR